MLLFTTKKISNTTISISDITDVHSFLVEGRDRAVLIDTGTGAGDMKAFVETLTQKPVEVILTHGHSDHASGAARFEKVYLNKADWELVTKHATMERKKEYVVFTQGGMPENLTDQDFCPERTAGYLPLENGQVFDLGGVVLEAVTVPGHTRGMTCIINQTERSIIFGDACNPAVFLWDEEATSVEEYKESLIQLKKRENEYDTVILSHGPEIIGKEILDGVLEVCNEILEGKSDEKPFLFMDYQGLKLAKEILEDGSRKDGGLGNIVFNSKKIYRHQTLEK